MNEQFIWLKNRTETIVPVLAWQLLRPLSASRRPGAWSRAAFPVFGLAATPTAASTGRSSASATPAGAWILPLERRFPAPCTPMTRPGVGRVRPGRVRPGQPPQVRMFPSHSISSHWFDLFTCVSVCVWSLSWMCCFCVCRDDDSSVGSARDPRVTLRSVPRTLDPKEPFSENYCNPVE